MLWLTWDLDEEVALHEGCTVFQPLKVNTLRLQKQSVGRLGFSQGFHLWLVDALSFAFPMKPSSGVLASMLSLGVFF